MNLVLAMRTADRSPKRNYVAQTIRSLLAAGFDLKRLHLFPTDPDVTWLARELDHQPDVMVHIPTRRYTPNGNGIRCIEALDWQPADWILLLEDDLDVRSAVEVSVWLEMHADPAVAVYRLFALPGTPLRKADRTAAWAPLRELRGSQAIALRASDARLFAQWALAHPRDWRPRAAPFQDRPDRGFDKLIGYWALDRWPDQPYGLVSVPMLVNHVGRESLLHSHGVSNDAQFAGSKR